MIPNLKNINQAGWRYTNSLILMVKLLAMASGFSQSDIVNLMLMEKFKSYEGKKIKIDGISFELPKLADNDDFVRVLIELIESCISHTDGEM